MRKVAIVGAGLSGLSVAHLLKEHADVAVFEKARGVSGRMSTRRAEPYFFDHGAQYFTARTAPFQAFIQPMIEQGVIERWDARYVALQGSQVAERKLWSEDEPRYVGVPGMNQVAKYLAQGIDVHLNKRIVALEKTDKWQLTDEEGTSFSGFDWVVCTAPSAQAELLLPNYFRYHAQIKAVEMRACFSLMLGFNEPLPLDFDAAHVSDSTLSWIAVNSAKPNRVGEFSLLIHSTDTYAEAHIDDDRDQVMVHLIKETSRILQCDVSSAEYKSLHGWRYANNAVRSQSNDVFLDQENKLAACGDWCVGGRVEGAFTAAYQLANTMKEMLL